VKMKTPDSDAYRALLDSFQGETLSEEQKDAQVAFRDRVLQENELQNLTRLTSPQDFFEGHFLDAWHLAKTGWVSQGRGIEIGSGGGIPGIPAALLSGSHWVLSDSEGRKADFLDATAREMGLSPRVEAFSGRAETFLKNESVDWIVARAVGPVGRIFAWLENCSTWNTLILLKARGWEEEWSSPDARKARARLSIAATHEYSVGVEQKYRVIVRLERKR